MSSLNITVSRMAACIGSKMVETSWSYAAYPPRRPCDHSSSRESCLMPSSVAWCSMGASWPSMTRQRPKTPGCAPSRPCSASCAKAAGHAAGRSVPATAGACFWSQRCNRHHSAIQRAGSGEAAGASPGARRPTSRAAPCQSAKARAQLEAQSSPCGPLQAATPARPKARSACAAHSGSLPAALATAPLLEVARTEAELCGGRKSRTCST
mmetsp:Transcript_49237/g.157490  ORF Transcript_49237/g.157490 Transcript_49237/m.157490 type:complete len:210 (+) Transcript_49237:1085-1714(+)